MLFLQSALLDTLLPVWELHGSGVVHEDLYHIFLTNKRGRFIDLEDSNIGPVDDEERWSDGEMQAAEKAGLAERLADQTRRGRSWTST